MNRISIRLLVALCTLAFGLAAVSLWPKSRRLTVAEKTLSSNLSTVLPVAPASGTDISLSPNLPILDYCELANHPERYSGTIVRVRARLSGFIHGMLFYDENCAGADNRTAVSYNQSKADEITQTLNRARGSDNSMNWIEPVNIIAIGKFNKVEPSNKSDAIYDTASLQFEIMRVEKATKAN